MPDPQSIGVAACIAVMSGLNLPLAALALGLCVRLDIQGFGSAFPQLEPFGQTMVLAISAAAAAGEFLVDRIPRLDSKWDRIGYLLRPAGAAFGVYVLFSDSALAVPAAIIAGAGALCVHMVKASVRLRLNATGSYSKNVAVSNLEDAVVIGIAVLLIHQPLVSALVSGVLVGLAVWYSLSHFRRPPSDSNGEFSSKPTEPQQG